MASPKTKGAVHSNAIGIFNEISTGAFQIIAYSTSGSLELNRETIDATTKDNDGANVKIMGGQSWSMSCDGVVNYVAQNASGADVTDVESSLDLFDAWAGKTELTLAWTTGADDGTDTDYMYKGKAFITSYSETAGVNDVATYSVSFESTGDIAKVAISTETFSVVD
jgi:TP901-1 family phage major tail protein